MKILNFITIIALICLLSIACSKNNQQEKQAKRTTKAASPKVEKTNKNKQEAVNKAANKNKKIIPEAKPKSFKDKLAIVEKGLSLDQDQMKNIKTNHTNFIANRKNCLSIAEKDAKATCLKSLGKKRWDGFLKILNKKQKNKFFKLRKESKIAIP